MDFEFHYYITGIIARRAGFSENDAEIIAYASQFVDDNNAEKCLKQKSVKILGECLFIIHAT